MGESKLTELLDRVRDAAGPDRELDADVFDIWGDGHLIWDLGEPLYLKRPAGAVRQTRYDVPRYTASIDAALALTERVLPGWHVTMATFHTDYGGPYADAASTGYINNIDGHDDEFAESAGATIPLAILAAALTALIALEAQQ